MHQHRHDGGDYRRIELITGVSRRRRWTPAEKAALVAESLQPGVSVSDLARRSGVNRGLLQTWRRTAMREMEHGRETFVPLRVEDAAPIRQVGPSVTAIAEPSGATALPSVIELEGRGVRVRFSGPVDAGALRLVLEHFGRRA
jgi:transposase